MPLTKAVDYQQTHNPQVGQMASLLTPAVEAAQPHPLHTGRATGKQSLQQENHKIPKGRMSSEQELKGFQAKG